MSDEKKPVPVEQPKPIIVDNKMYDKEQVAPDGHVNLSKKDIDART